MFEYIFGILTFLVFRNYLTIFIVKRRLKKISKVKNEMRPIQMRGKKRKVVLLIHGFSSSPGEFRYLSNFLNKRGFAVVAPLLSGHGTSPENLTIVKKEMWIRDCEMEVKKLEEKYDEIILVGNSMGGSLSLIISNCSKKIKGVVVISTPMIYNLKNRFFNLIFPIMHRIKFRQKKKYGRKFKERVGKERIDAYNSVPLKGVLQLVKVIKFAKKNLKKVEKPILICQARDDEAMDSGSAKYIYENVSSENKKIFLVEDSIHMVLLDPLRNDLLNNEILKFVEGV